MECFGDLFIYIDYEYLILFWKLEIFIRQGNNELYLDNWHQPFILELANRNEIYMVDLDFFLEFVLLEYLNIFGNFGLNKFYFLDFLIIYLEISRLYIELIKYLSNDYNYNN